MPSLVTDPLAQAAQGQAQATALGAQQSQQNLMNSILARYLGIAASPGTTMTGATSMIPQMSPGEIENIQNQTQADMASRGFSQAPDLWQYSLANALGTAQTGLQNIGLANYRQSQQLPLSVSPTPVSGYSQQQAPDPLSSGIDSAAGGALGTGLMLALA